METITNLNEVMEVLSKYGYKAQLHGDDAVIALVGPFPTLLTIEPEANGEKQLKITCEIAKKADICPDNEADFLWAILDANNQICPFAVALIATEDLNDENDSIVLTNSVPLGDLSEQELVSGMTSLKTALFTVKDLMLMATAE